MLVSKHPLTGNACKTDCPVCGAKKRFRPFWDCRRLELVEGAGVCDRVNTCGAKITPSEARGEGWRDGAGHNANLELRRILAQRKREQEERNARIFPLNGVFHLWKTYGPPASLSAFLASLFGQELALKELDRYCVTSDGGGGAAFWQTDGKGTATTARIISYKPDGHRDKARAMDWAHAIAVRSGKLPEDYQPRKYPFGLNLLTTGARVLVVESEKTAILCSLYNQTHPNNGICGKYGVIVATGGAQMLETTMKTAAPIFAACGASLTLCPDDDRAGAGWIVAARRHGWKTDGTAARTAPTAGAGWDIGDTIAATMIQEQNTNKTI